MFKTYVLPLLLLTLLCTSGRAQQVEQVFGPDFYDNIVDADLSPGGNGWAVGNCGLYLKTTDGGANWTDVSDRFTTSASYVACLPGTNCETVFMTRSRGIMASFDGGDTWEDVAPDLYAGRFDFSVDGVIFGWGPQRREVVKSTDGGRTWVRYDTNDNQIKSNLLVTSEDEFGFFNDRAYWRTTDGGTTFTQASSIGQNVSLAIVANNGHLLVVDRNTQMWQSTDKGETWSVLNERIYQYTVHRGLWQDADDVLHYTSFLGIHVTSADGGLTWERVSSGVRLWSLSSTRVLEDGSHLAVGSGNSLHRYNPVTNEYDYLLGDVHPEFMDMTFAPDGETAYAITRDGLVYKSADAGNTWAYVSTPETGDPLRLYVNSADEVVLLGERNGMMVSTDGGASFTEITTGSLLSNFNRGDMIPTDNGEYFIMDANSFGRIKADGEVVYANDVEMGNVSKLFFLDDMNGFAFGIRTLMRTTDGGVTWSEPTIDGTLGFTNTQMFFFDNQYGVMVGSTIMETRDGGENWARAADFEPGNSIAPSLTGDTLYLHNRTRIYQALTSDPSQWEEVIDMGACVFSDILMRRPGSTELFSMETSGIAKLDPFAFPVSVRPTAATVSPLRVFPNPTDGLVKLDLPYLPGQSATAEVFSSDGRRILSLRLAGTDGWLDLGREAAGIYTVRVADGGKIWTGRVVVR